MKHGAVIVKGGRVLAVGVNANRNIATNTSFPKFENAVHAEVAALKACSDTVGATLYVARVNNQGEERMSKPCPACYAAIVKAGIRKVIFTIESEMEVDICL
jgi:tRNA(Arg) A34 adenosine deaminase TadA